MASSFEPAAINQYFPVDQQQQQAALIAGRVGLTRRRAECFLRLWAYLWLKSERPELGSPDAPEAPQPITQLERLAGPVSCTCREAAELFYAETERGSERSAGMMLDKLAALGLIDKRFDGNTLTITIHPVPELLTPTAAERPEVQVDAFDPRCDAIPVANFLARNYSWMNSSDATPFQIMERLRSWAEQYSTGMRVLRRCDNLNPVGFYLLYPTQRSSEVHFFGPPSKALHLNTASEELLGTEGDWQGRAPKDRFEMAQPGSDCRAVFVRSWVLQEPYREVGQPLLLLDSQQIFTQMLQDFPSLCDIYTLMIHPSFEPFVNQLGFQRTVDDSQSSMYWMYLPLDRFLNMNFENQT